MIDTPGVRSFGLSHVTPGPDRGRLRRPGRDHRRLPARLHATTATAPECALDDAVADGELAPARLESFRRMLGSGQ